MEEFDITKSSDPMNDMLRHGKTMKDLTTDELIALTKETHVASAFFSMLYHERQRRLE